MRMRIVCSGRMQTSSDVMYFIFIIEVIRSVSWSSTAPLLITCFLFGLIQLIRQSKNFDMDFKCTFRVVYDCHKHDVRYDIRILLIDAAVNTFYC